MKDVIGNTLEIGDRVVTTVSGYEELQVRYIHSFTPKKVRLASTPSLEFTAGIKSPRQLVKVPNA